MTQSLLLESHETLSSSTIPEPTAVAPPPSPASHLVSPPIDDAQSASLISPPQPIRQFQPLEHETSFASSAVSVSSVAGTMLSEDSRNVSQTSLGAFSHGHGRAYHGPNASDAGSIDFQFSCNDSVVFARSKFH